MHMYTGKVPKGLLYVAQDNYCFVNPEKTDLTYLYSDSATSCIIMIVVGVSKQGEPLVGMSHLSKKVRYEAFFQMVEERFACLLYTSRCV